MTGGTVAYKKLDVVGLAEVVKANGDKKRILQSAELLNLLAAGRAFPSSVQVQHGILTAMKHAVVGRSQNGVQIADCDGLPAVLSILTKHVLEAAIQEIGGELLKVMVSKHPASLDALLALHPVATILAGMNAHKSTNQVAAVCCSLFKEFCEREAGLRELLDSGVLSKARRAKALLSTSSGYPGSPASFDVGVLLLELGVDEIDAPEAKGIFEQLRIRGDSGEGITAVEAKALTAAMAAHEKTGTLQLAACTAIALLAHQHEGNRKLLVTAGCLPCLNAAIELEVGPDPSLAPPRPSSASLSPPGRGLPGYPPGMPPRGPPPGMPGSFSKKVHASELLERACWAAVLLSAHPSNREVIVSAGLLKTVLRALGAIEIPMVVSSGPLSAPGQQSSYADGVKNSVRLLLHCLLKLPSAKAVLASVGGKDFLRRFAPPSYVISRSEVWRGCQIPTWESLLKLFEMSE